MRLFATLAIILLVTAGLLLAIAHNPEETFFNLQAEVVGNYAYLCFLLAFITAMFSSFGNKDHKK